MSCRGTWRPWISCHKEGQGDDQLSSVDLIN